MCEERAIKDRIILDLCGGTGAWSQPYREAGYDVRLITLPDNNVRNFVCPDEPIWGILAAPPCTMFSYARSRAKAPRDIEGAMKTVKVCLEIIWKAQYKVSNNAKKTLLKFWALENPYGFLRFFLGQPALIFQPYDYGDRYQKKTCLWGHFKEPKESLVKLTEKEKVKFATNSQKLKPLPLYNPMFNQDDYKLPHDMEYRQARRSITPAGFAKAFFEANR